MSATRPKGPTPILASTDLYPSSLNPWSLQPTKADPGLAILAAGFLPNDPIVIEWWNFLHNQIGRRVALTDLIDAKNWPEPAREAGIIGSGAGSDSGEISYAPWHARKPLYFVNNGTASIWTSKDDGYTWSADHTPGGTFYPSIAHLDQATAAIYVNGGNYRVVGNGPDGLGDETGWDALTLGSSPNLLSVVVGDPYISGGAFWVGGRTTTPRPGIWKVPANGGLLSGAAQLFKGPASGADAVTMIACGPQYKIGGSFVAANSLWRWEDNVGAAASVTPPTSKEIRDLLWIPEEGIYMLLTAGTDPSEVWISSTGATGSWSQRVQGAASILQVGEFDFRSAAVRGSTIVAAYTRGTEHGLVISTDAGISWEWIPDPMYRHNGTAPQPLTRRIRLLGDRLRGTGYKAAGSVYQISGLRTG